MCFCSPVLRQISLSMVMMLRHPYRDEKADPSVTFRLLFPILLDFGDATNIPYAACSGAQCVELGVRYPSCPDRGQLSRCRAPSGRWVIVCRGTGAVEGSSRDGCWCRAVLGFCEGVLCIGKLSRVMYIFVPICVAFRSCLAN